jgi:hypothetical protein
LLLHEAILGFNEPLVRWIAQTGERQDNVPDD